MSLGVERISNPFYILGILMILALMWQSADSIAQAQEPQATPPPVLGPARLAPPVMPANPSQADYGAQVYWQVCMSCHGDQGQGLSAEFRALWGEEEQNCWQSKCHASNHPAEGFKLPAAVPAIIGNGRLNHYQTSEDLYSFISLRMPWQAPGSLSDTQYRQLTAYLLQANNHPAATQVEPSPQNEEQTPASSGLIGLIIALALLSPLLLILNLSTTQER